MNNKIQEFEEQYQELLKEEEKDENKKIGLITIIWVLILIIILVSASITVYNYKLKKLDVDKNKLIEKEAGIVITFKHGDSINKDNQKIDIIIENIGNKDLNYELELFNSSINLYNELNLNISLDDTIVKTLPLSITQRIIYNNTIKQNSKQTINISLNDYSFSEEESFESDLKINILK